MASGDTLLIRGGTYVEGMAHGVGGFRFISGTASAMTRYAAYPGEQVIIKPPASYPTSNSVYFPDNFAGYVEIGGLTIDQVDMSDKGYGIKGHRNSRLIGNVIRNAGMGMSGGHNNQIIGNEIYNMTDYGIYTGPGENTLVACNRIHDTGGFAIHHYQSSKTGKTANNWTYRNNVIYRSGRGYTHALTGNTLRTAPAVIIASGRNNKFYNNIIYDSSSGISVNYGSIDSLIANNTIYGNDKGGIMIWSGGGSRGTRVINNISYGNNGNQIQDNGTGTVLQNNLTTNPNFVNAAGRDFKLQSGSPAINAGVSLSEVPNDADGGTRGPAWDIGAYEFGASPDPAKACDAIFPPESPGGGTIDLVPPATARPPSSYDPGASLCGP